MKLNKERLGRGITVKAMYSPEELNCKMNTVAEYMTGVFVPSDVRWEADTYSFYVSHRQSLREYVSENGITKEEFFDFIKSIINLFDKAAECGIDPHEFIFDYECIFVGETVSEAEFIYAPDGEMHKNGYIAYNKCSDMVAIVSLNIENDVGSLNRHEDDISEILTLLSEWESNPLCEQGAFPRDKLMALMSKPKKFSHVGEFLKDKIKKAIGDFTARMETKGDSDMKLNGEMLLKGVKYTSDSNANKDVNIGRDGEWADLEVNKMYVSRKHATIYKENGTWYIKDLNSTNGTFVNGARIVSDRPFSLNNGYEISFGIPESKLIFCLP